MRFSTSPVVEGIEIERDAGSGLRPLFSTSPVVEGIEIPSLRPRRSRSPEFSTSPVVEGIEIGGALAGTRPLRGSVPAL